MPTDTLNKIISVLSHTWDAVGPFQTVIVLTIPVVAWLVRKPVTDIIMKAFFAMVKGLHKSISDDIKKTLVPAGRLIVVTTGVLIAHDIISMPEPYFSIVYNLLVSLYVIAVFSASYSLCVYIPQLFVTKKKIPVMENDGVTVRVTQTAVVFLGIAAVMKVWGIDIGPALTGMGVVGAAVALAAQDYLKNLLGGLNNAAEHRFSIGDLISVEGLVEGTVESVALRSTVIRRLDTTPVHVPNSELANSAIINYDRRIYRRIYWKISLTYSSSVETLREICQRVEKYIHDSDYFVSADKARLLVRIDSFNESSIDMLVYCFTRSRLYVDYLDAKNDLALAIKTIVVESDGGFAFPTRSIFIEASDAAGPAQFIAADTEDEAVTNKDQKQ